MFNKQEFFDIFGKAVVKLTNKITGEVIDNPTISILEEDAWSSATDKTLHIYVNDVKLKKIKDYQVTYICPKCQTE